jgi:hypothetical protein
LIGEGRVLRVGYPGRRRRTYTKDFYTLPDFKYDDILGQIEQKRRVSAEVNAMLTGHAPATFFAEDLFERAFNSLGFEILDRDASQYKGKKVQSVEGKEPPNLDFILTRDSIVYGVDIKNWIRYEYNTREEVISKTSLALQLGITPFIIARYVDKDTMYTQVIVKGGLCYPFRTLLFSPDYSSVADLANSVLGYPTVAMERLPKHKVDWVAKLHRGFVGRRG